MSVVIAASRPGYEDAMKWAARRLGKRVVFLTRKEKLTPQYLRAIKAERLFFIHWSYLIPVEVYERFECVIFHMTDVPFGRGGSPLQNLLARGIYRTKLSALRCTASLDGGPVYLKKTLRLEGRAQDIYERMSQLAARMIVEIASRNPQPRAQKGMPVYFKRRKPEQSDLSSVSGLQKTFDHIRMLDADGYPKAFLDTKKCRFEFDHAELKKGKLTAHVTITKK